MTAADLWNEDHVLTLSREELRLLRFTCDLTTLEESPFGPLDALGDGRSVEASVKRLSRRSILDPSTLRPRREVLRRLLIVSQPDARVILLRGGPNGPRRELDLYERARALVPYRRLGADHELGRSVGLTQAIEELARLLPTRRSGGDYIDFTLTATEYFVFSILAGDLLSRKLGRTGATPRPRRTIAVEGLEPPTAKQRISPALVATLRSGMGDEGTPIQQVLGGLPKDQSRPEKGSPEWQATIEVLAGKDLVAKNGDRCVLRPFLHDLALGLARRDRVVLTRFDFGAKDWIVRDATMVAVQGSLFLIRPQDEGVIRIVELDPDGLTRTARFTIEPLADQGELVA